LPYASRLVDSDRDTPVIADNDDLGFTSQFFNAFSDVTGLVYGRGLVTKILVKHLITFKSVSMYWNFTQKIYDSFAGPL